MVLDDETGICTCPAGTTAVEGECQSTDGGVPSDGGADFDGFTDPTDAGSDETDLGQDAGPPCVWGGVPGDCDEPAELAASASHACLRTEAGRVYCWGSNARGALGRGEASTVPEPTPTLVAGITATRVSVGTQLSCATNAEGELWCWGDNSYGQLGPDAGDAEFLATPTRVADLVADAIAPVVGGSHVCALLSTNELWCWGSNNGGQLGNGDQIDQTEPSWVPIRGLAGASAGSQVTCAWTRGGRGYCWGLPAALGDGSAAGTQASRPERLGEFEDIVEISAARLSICARHEGGTVSCWGDNSAGQVGQDASTSVAITPTTVPEITGATDLAGGNTHFCILDSDSRASCWGDNQLGPLGERPTETFLPPGNSGAGAVTSLASKGGYTCALRDAELPICWGYNDNGQLGRGTASFFEATPEPIVTPDS
ncbi:MAG: hypothetical protein JJ863_22285 [Deltaproteobacteria bacterium]|nr:hypothetical protein [Deltaproteobacteria bacterium]